MTKRTLRHYFNFWWKRPYTNTLFKSWPGGPGMNLNPLQCIRWFLRHVIRFTWKPCICPCTWKSFPQIGLYVKTSSFIRSSCLFVSCVQPVPFWGKKGRYELFIATRFLILSLSYWSGNHVLLCVAQRNTCGHNAKLQFFLGGYLFWSSQWRFA